MQERRKNVPDAGISTMLLFLPDRFGGRKEMSWRVMGKEQD
jgi:hypothetical protein